MILALERRQYWQTDYLVSPTTGDVMLRPFNGFGDVRATSPEPFLRGSRAVRPSRGGGRGRGKHMTHDMASFFTD